jgi:hypothetical protein
MGALQAARRVRVLPPLSPHLSVARSKGGGEDGSKVASGMEVTYTVTFTPDEDCRHDFRGELLVVTEREKFVVPVIGIGGPSQSTF